VFADKLQVKFKIYLASFLGWNEGQLPPAARNTSSEGIKRDFIEKTVQEWGNDGSQLTLK
jgi:hypothetical protein